jgi:uncharacterized protein (TIGR03435 family)
MSLRFAGMLLLGASALPAQQKAPAAFEAASLKPAAPGRSVNRSLRGGPGTSSPGQITGTVSVKTLVMRAYELKKYQIAGPAWMDSEVFELTAKIPEGATKPDVAPMLRSLLAERFRLVAHLETRELPIYALTLARGGPKFKESPPSNPEKRTPGIADDGSVEHRAVPRFVSGSDGLPELAAGAVVPRSYEIVVGGSDGLIYKLWARRETMQQLAERLTGQVDRPVLDRTGLTGEYDFALTWTVEMAGGVVPRTDPPPDQIEFHGTLVMSDPGLSIFTALQKQLGLKLEQRKAAVGMLVVDGIERTPVSN